MFPGYWLLVLPVLMLACFALNWINRRLHP